MRFLAVLLSAPVIDLLALFLAVLWMLRDERDKTRPLLVFALVLNLFFGALLAFFLGREGSLLPWKYDHILFHLDAALGISATAIAPHLQGVWLMPLRLAYDLLLFGMIFSIPLAPSPRCKQALVMAFVAELVLGPVLYAIVPGCGPAYAFGTNWLHPGWTDCLPVRLANMPNAFPSLHAASAAVLFLLSERRVVRAIAAVFLVLTILATLALGEHYAIDLFPGLVFGCFAAAFGRAAYRTAALYLGITLLWSLSVRFQYRVLVAHPALLRALAIVTGFVILRALLPLARRATPATAVLPA